MMSAASGGRLPSAPPHRPSTWEAERFEHHPVAPSLRCVLEWRRSLGPVRGDQEVGAHQCEDLVDLGPGETTSRRTVAGRPGRPDRRGGASTRPVVETPAEIVAEPKSAFSGGDAPREPARDADAGPGQTPVRSRWER
jgi:hypothetical protein